MKAKEKVEKQTKPMILHECNTKQWNKNIIFYCDYLQNCLEIKVLMNSYCINNTNKGIWAYPTDLTLLWLHHTWGEKTSFVFAKKKLQPLEAEHNILSLTKAYHLFYCPLTLCSFAVLSFARCLGEVWGEKKTYIRRTFEYFCFVCVKENIWGSLCSGRRDGKFSVEAKWRSPLVSASLWKRYENVSIWCYNDQSKLLL